MRTKIEIIKAEVPYNCIWEDKLDNAPFKYVEAAMDEFAKETAIDFRKWYKDKVIKSVDLNVTEFVALPAETLFDLYQQEKSTLK